MEEFLQGHHVRQGQLAENRVQILHRDPHLRGHLRLGGRAVQFGLERGVRTLDVARLLADGTGIQSSARSSSIIAPRIRVMAYVSNLMDRSGSNFSMASMSPKIPDETKSACSTLGGRPTLTRPATYLTSGE